MLNTIMCIRNIVFRDADETSDAACGTSSKVRERECSRDNARKHSNEPSTLASNANLPKYASGASEVSLTWPDTLSACTPVAKSTRAAHNLSVIVIDYVINAQQMCRP